MQKIVLLGATGSVGESTVRVMRAHREKFSVYGFSYHQNFNAAREFASEFGPKYVCCTARYKPEEKLHFEKHGCSFLTDLNDLASLEYDSLLTAVVGAAGVRVTLKAAELGRKILLANKESLVMAGAHILAAAQKNGARIIPVDSEHNSMFRLLENRSDVRDIILTASGGPLRLLSDEELRSVTRAQVLSHPTWNMGDKITVDSAGMVNKALEVIEAHFLFGYGFDQISAVIHPQSVVHAALRHGDGSFSMHLSHPDMVYPIAHSLFYPEAPPEIVAARPLSGFQTFEFSEVERSRFPGYHLGIAAGQKGGCYPAVFNAANEQAVALFLQDRISFSAIAAVLESVLGAVPEFGSDLDALFAADQWARARVIEVLP